MQKSRLRRGWQEKLSNTGQPDPTVALFRELGTRLEQNQPDTTPAGFHIQGGRAESWAQLGPRVATAQSAQRAGRGQPRGQGQG